MMTDSEPSSTKLFNIPMTMNGKNANCLIYTNDLTSNNDQELMIVPIPSFQNATEFGLIDVNADRLKQFRKDVERECENLVPQTKSYSMGFRSMGDSLSYGPRMIHRVGNYDISIAHNLTELQNNIDWSHFKLPNDFQRRMDTLSNNLLYPFACAYVVAKAINSIKNDGFGVVYLSDATQTYFPTAHENNSSGKHNFDVKCYNFSDKRVNLNFDNRSSYSQSKVSTYVFDRSPQLKSMLELLPTRCVSSVTGSPLLLTVAPNLDYINYTPIEGHYVNQNIMV